MLTFRWNTIFQARIRFELVLDDLSYSSPFTTDFVIDIIFVES